MAERLNEEITTRGITDALDPGNDNSQGLPFWTPIPHLRTFSILPPSVQEA
jgi:hypothetical protein